MSAMTGCAGVGAVELRPSLSVQPPTTSSVEPRLRPTTHPTPALPQANVPPRARDSDGRSADELAARPDEACRYRLLSGVTLAPSVQEKVAELADAYFQRT